MEVSGFGVYLAERGLSARTCRAYLGVVSRAGSDPIPWLRKLAVTKPPTGTFTQAKSAIKHWLTFSGRKDEIGLLPVATGRKSELIQGLNELQLAHFIQIAEKEKEPVRTILLLLPRSGLRIEELCSLNYEDVILKPESGSIYLSFRGKGDKHRIVPLGREGRGVMQQWLEKRGSGAGCVFPGRGGAIRPTTIRAVCRRLRVDHPQLPANLSPHILRHTYATRSLVGGVDLARLKSLLGHSDIRTTQRYLHPTVEDLEHAVEAVEGL